MISNPSLIESASFCEALPEHWAYALVQSKKEDGLLTKRWEMVNLNSQGKENCRDETYRYLCEPLKTIRWKCAGVASILPMYTVAYMIWHAVRTPLSSLHVFFQCFEDVLTEPSFKAFTHLALEAPKQLVKSLWLVVRSPLFMLAMQSAALYGIAVPVEGRRVCGVIEKKWKGGLPLERDVGFKQRSEDAYHFFWRACTSADFSDAFYLAECFQPLGSLNDPSVVSVEFF